MSGSRSRFESDDDLWRKDAPPERADPVEVTVLRADARFDLDELAARARPALRAIGAERAIAFGSYARGEGDGFSDLDLAIVVDTDLPRAERHRLLEPLFEAMPVTLDALVYTPEEWARGLSHGFGIFHAISEQGVSIYERSRQG